jgi:hypothetical protein
VSGKDGELAAQRKETVRMEHHCKDLRDEALQLKNENEALKDKNTKSEAKIADLRKEVSCQRRKLKDAEVEKCILQSTMTKAIEEKRDQIVERDKKIERDSKKIKKLEQVRLIRWSGKLNFCVQIELLSVTILYNQKVTFGAGWGPPFFRLLFSSPPPFTRINSISVSMQWSPTSHSYRSYLKANSWFFVMDQTPRSNQVKLSVISTLLAF